MRTVVVMLVCGVVMGVCGCVSSSGTDGPKNDLAALAMGQVVINGHAFDVWLATLPESRELGLMNVTAEELGEDQGMLFVFASSTERAFWMKNTIIPLDIAYIRSDGKIVKIHTMEPLTLAAYPSEAPARYALEVNAGRLAALGIAEGDTVELPDTVR